MSRPLDYLRWLELQDELATSGNHMQEVDVPVEEPGRPMSQAEADGHDRRKAEYDKQTDAAQADWLDGECCGREQWRNCHGYCELAKAPCYAHPRGLLAAWERWQWFDDEEFMSPWTRAVELTRLLKEMDEYVEKNSGNDPGTQSDGDALGCNQTI
jgi:hypothetical protein